LHFEYIVDEGQGYILFASLGGQAIAALADTVGPASNPLLGAISKTEGSSKKGMLLSNPGTVIAVVLYGPPAPGICITLHLAVTLVGLLRSSVP